MSELEHEPVPVGQKLRGLIWIFLHFEARDDDPRAAVALRLMRFTARRLAPTFEAIAPPLDDENAWNELLSLMVGVLLNVISDGVEVDVDASREAARVTLEQLFEQAAGA